MKILLGAAFVLLLLLVCAFCIDRAFDGRAEALAMAAEMEAAQDSALALAGRAQAEADSVAAVLDSLETVRAEEKAAAARRAAVLRARADSLEGAIGALMPPETVAVEIREAVMDAVGELRQTYEVQITDLTALLASTEASLAEAVELAETRARVNVNLRDAFDAMEAERDLWKGIAQPGLLTRLKRDAPKVAIAYVLGWLTTR